MLVRRWGVLWGPIRLRLDKVGVVVQACCNLHNMCLLDMGMREPALDEECLRMLGSTLPEVHLQGDCHTGDPQVRARARNPSIRRDLLTAALVRHGLRRPSYSTNGNHQIALHDDDRL
jgi:hypothetical protein